MYRILHGRIKKEASARAYTHKQARAALGSITPVIVPLLSPHTSVADYALGRQRCARARF